MMFETTPADARGGSVPTGAHLSSAENVLTRKVGDELVLLHMGTEIYFGLDPVGVAMWDARSTDSWLSATLRMASIGALTHDRALKALDGIRDQPPTRHGEPPLERRCSRRSSL